MFKKILVPTDGSNASKAAFAKAVELAKVTDAEIVLFNVAFSPESYWGKALASGIAISNNEISAAGLGIIQETQKVVDTINIKVTSVVETGNPAQKIIEYVNTNDFDLVVIGSVGHGSFTGTLLGSVSLKVLSGSKAPVMLVKDPDIQFYTYERRPVSDYIAAD